MLHRRDFELRVKSPGTPRLWARNANAVRCPRCLEAQPQGFRGSERRDTRGCGAQSTEAA
eukprot:4657867-Prymnesium_polylepis.1